VVFEYFFGRFSSEDWTKTDGNHGKPGNGRGKLGVWSGERNVWMGGREVKENKNSRTVAIYTDEHCPVDKASTSRWSNQNVVP